MNAGTQACRLVNPTCPTSARKRRRARHLVALLTLSLTTSAIAGDVVWDNGTTNSTWDTGSANWTGGIWNNAAGDGAIFDSAGVGPISVAGAINVDSLHFKVDGYSLNGPGSINLVAGTSTQTTAVFNVEAGANAIINVPINSAVGFQKIGAGTLELNAPVNITGDVPLTSNGNIRTDFIIGGTSGTIAAGTTRVGSGVLPSTTRVSIANGYLDIGANDTTISQLTFVSQNPSAPWNTTLNANNGVLGTGKLRVLGEIHVLGQTGNNAGNTIAAPLDIGGGTQIIRSGLISSIALSQAIMFTAPISNGSIFKSVGYGVSGVFGSVDGMGLLADNTYAGSTTLNNGTTVITGTNKTSSLKVVGPTTPAGSNATLQGEFGSLSEATTITSSAGAQFIIDNNAALGASGNNAPNIPAFQNNDRVNDNAAINLRESSFIYRGKTGEVATETAGSINVLGGHGLVTISPNGLTGTGTGTAAVTLTGDLTLASRSTLSITTPSSSSLLGGSAKLFVNGTTPAADATGIMRRVASGADFLTYNAITGVTPYTGYTVNSFATPNTNVSVTSANTVASSVAINALKSSGTFTTTIASGAALTIDSGMILNATGTHTIAGPGSLAFGANPGVFFGSATVSAPITGSDGLVAANGTVTLSGDLSGLTCTLTANSATINLNTNTFTGPIHARSTATISLGVSQTGAGLGAITLGYSGNEADMFTGTPTLSFSAAGANAVIDRDIIIDNGGQTAAGIPLQFSYVAKFTPLSNNTGSQTLSGDITLNSPLNMQGGGGTGAGATNFTGDITGPGRFLATNGRMNFSGAYSGTGGWLIGNTGFTTPVTFSGTATGNAPINVRGGSTISSTSITYAAGSLPGGLITIETGGLTNAAAFVPSEDSTLPNAWRLDGVVLANVASPIKATWSGPMTGQAAILKRGDGVLNLTNDTFKIEGGIQVEAGTLNIRHHRLNNGNTNVFAGATLQISAQATSPDSGATSVFDDTSAVLSLDGGATPTATLDIGRQAVIFDYTNATLDTLIRAQVVSGRAGGTWTGTGITSTAAAAAPAKHGVGTGEATEFANLAGLLLGQSFDSTSILVRYTLLGDADLNGSVLFDDLLILAQNYEMPGSDRWAKGDFDYSGAVNFDDLLVLAQNYDLSASVTGSFDSDWALAQSLVPEPGSMLAIVAAGAMLRRRR